MYAEIIKVKDGYWAGIHLYAGGCKGSVRRATKQEALDWVASVGITDIVDCDTI